MKVEAVYEDAKFSVRLLYVVGDLKRRYSWNNSTKPETSRTEAEVTSGTEERTTSDDDEVAFKVSIHVLL